MIEVLAGGGDDIILSELNHRFFNSLQIVASGLHACGRSGAAPPMLRSQLADLGERISSMAALHRSLAQAPPEGCLQQHCSDLCLNLVKGFGRQDVVLVVSMGEFRLSPFQNLRIALLVVELVTNSLKHSRPLDAALTIHISVSLDYDTLELVAQDTGGPARSPNAGESRIVVALAGSLGGSAEVCLDRGYSTRVRFPRVLNLTASNGSGRPFRC